MAEHGFGGAAPPVLHAPQRVATVLLLNRERKYPLSVDSDLAERRVRAARKPAGLPASSHRKSKAGSRHASASRRDAPSRAIQPAVPAGSLLSRHPHDRDLQSELSGGLFLPCSTRLAQRLVARAPEEEPRRPASHQRNAQLRD